MLAHVVCQLQNPGSSAVSNRFEWYINGMVVASYEATAGSVSNVEIDVPENSSVYLSVAAIGSDGQMSWTSSETLYTGTAPTPTPTPTSPPGPPSLGSLTIAYWS
jgi:hypothetical protein